MIGEGEGNFLLAAYRSGKPRNAYVAPRVEIAGIELDGIELNGADLTDTQGYSTRWYLPAGPIPFKVPGALI
jgi:hypothetical protein